MADTKPTERQNDIQFRQLLEEAVSKPGTLMKAYSLFWNYSLGNQILAHMNGNVQGYAKGRAIAINPLAHMPAKTTFHELAHIELGHTSEAVHDSEQLPRNLREVEAEA